MIHKIILVILALSQYGSGLKVAMINVDIELEWMCVNWKAKV